MCRYFMFREDWVFLIYLVAVIQNRIVIVRML